MRCSNILRLLCPIIVVSVLILSTSRAAVAQGRPDINWMRGTPAGQVTGVAVSPDGRLVATATGGSGITLDRNAKVYRRSDGMLLRTFFQPINEWCGAVAFSPDSKLLVSAGSQARIWNIETGALIHVLTGHTGSVWALAFSGDGRHVATGGYDKTVRVWRVTDGALLRTFEGHTGYVSSVALSPDGELIASGGGNEPNPDYTVRVWRVSDGSCTILAGPGPDVRGYRVQFTADGDSLLCGAYVMGTTIPADFMRWRLPGLQLVQSLKLGGRDARQQDISFSSDGLVGVYHSADVANFGWLWQSTRIYNLTSGALIKDASSQPSHFVRCAISEDKRALFLAGEGMALYDIPSGQSRMFDINRKAAILGIAAGPMFTSTIGSGIQIRSNVDGRIAKDIRDYHGDISCSADGKLLATCYLYYVNDYLGGFAVLSIPDGNVVRLIDLKSSPPYRVAISPDGRFLVGKYQAGMGVWRVSDGALVKTLPPVGEKPLFCRNGNYLLAAGNSSVLYRTSDWTEVRRFNVPTGLAESYAISSDGAAVAIGTYQDMTGNLFVWRGEASSPMRIESDRRVRAVEFSSEGLVIAYSVGDGRLKFCAANDLSHLSTMDEETGAPDLPPGYPAGVLSIRYSPDAKFIYLGRADGAVLSMLNPFRNTIIPNHGGNTGNVTVKVITALDFPLAEGSTVVLKGEGLPTIAPISTKRETDYVMTATFDLRGAPLGKRDVVVSSPAAGERTYGQAFEIQKGKSAHLSISLLGRDILRAGQPSKYVLSINNLSNVDGYAYPLRLSFPSGFTWSLPFEMELPPSSEGDHPIDWTGVPYHFADEASTYVPLLIPSLGAGGTWIGNVAVTPPNSAINKQLPIQSWAVNSIIDANFEGMQGDDTTIDDCLTALTNLAVAQLVNLIPGSCAIQIVKQVIQAIRIRVFNNFVSGIQGKPWPYLYIMQKIVYQTLICLGKQLPPLKVALAIEDLLLRADQLKPCFQWAHRSWEDVKWLVVFASRDPNEVSGPSGYSPARWIPGAMAATYNVMFENLAGPDVLPAAKVIVTDNIDPTKFDTTTVQIGTITVAGKTISPTAEFALPVGQREFNADLDMRPEKEFIVRINAKLDMLTGDLVWTFQTIDPATNEPPEDPLAGFLNPGEEGSMLVSVMPKPDLPTGTVVTNQASIVFDFNDPILTPVWFNTIDNDVPFSAVTKLASTQKTSRFTVRWAGPPDVGSGLKDYSVYYSTDGGEYQSWLNNTTLTSSTFTGVGGHSYRFYSVARDNAGNIEAVPADADTSTTVLLCVDNVKAQPNPVAGSLKTTVTVTLTGPTPDGGAVIVLTSSNPGVAPVPATVTVPKDQSSATFEINTTAVSASTPVTLSATWKGIKKTTKLTVRPIGPLTIMFSPTSVRSGKTTTGTVTLEAPAAPGDVTVTLSSNSGLLTVPLSVTIPAGSTSALFTATAGTASVTTSVKVTATRGTVTKTATVKVLANGVATLTLSPTSVKGGTDSQGTIGLDAIATVPTTVTLLPLDSLYARWVDAGGNPLNSVVIPVGQQSATVRIQTFPVTVKKTVSMKATANTLSKSAVLTVNP